MTGRDRASRNRVPSGRSGPAPQAQGRTVRAPRGGTGPAGTPLPRLRPLDFVTAEWNGERVVCGRDYEGLLDGPVILPLPIMLVALLLDGRRDLRAVQAEYVRLSGGLPLPSADLDRIVRDLDAHGLLDTPALEGRRRAVGDAYRAAPHRAMAHAGTAYPRDPAACAAALDRYLAAGAEGGPVPAAPPRGILAPHIDFTRGGSMYGRAYAPLAGLPAGPCLVVVGVAHAGAATPYVLTTKGFETPFGVVEVDRPLLEAVAQRAPFDPLAEEPVHRGEHSVEFQVVWLAHVLRGRDFTVLPLLTGPLDGHGADGTPAAVPAIAGFIAALREAMAAADRPVYVVGGVDLSHVGPRFGDADPVGPALAQRASRADLAALRHVEAGDAEGWWRSVAADGNRCHVCGLGAIYTVLRLLAPVTGRVLGYDQGFDPAGGLVGFSAVVLE